MAYFQPAGSSERAKGEYTLYVNNIPNELDRAGIKAIFDHYGKINQLFYRKNTNWAFVTYGTRMEAEGAIGDLHDKPPLCLKLSFAKQKVPNTTHASKPNINRSFDIENDNHSVGSAELSTPVSYTRGRGKPLDAIHKTLPTGTPMTKYKSDDDLLYPVPSDPNTYNPYENAEPYPSTNVLWKRDQLTVTSDGKRHVKNGRGYTSYEVPDPYPEIENKLTAGSEERSAGFLKYGKDTFEYKIGKCLRCSSMTKFYCERCHGFYCNKECQIADWPRHKVECQAIPALILAVNNTSLSRGNSEEQISARNISNTITPLRRPNRLLGKPANETINTPIQERLKFTERKQNSYATNVAETELDISFQKHILIPAEKFVSVRIITKSNDREYWVQKIDSDHDRENLMTYLQSEIDNSRKVQPQKGKIYAVQYESLWHRALVTSLTPLKVHYIDYGNDEVLIGKEVRTLKSSVLRVPRFCCKIRLSEKALRKYKNLKYEDILSVKRTCVDSDEVILVEVEGENEECNGLLNDVKDITLPSKNAKSKLPNVINTLHNGVEGILEVHAELSNNTYGITLLPHHIQNEFAMLLNDLPTQCQNKDAINPRIGDLICGLRLDGDWLRGYVLDHKTPLKMAIVDEARMMTISKSVACPQQFLDICTFGVVCRLIDTNTKLLAQETYMFKVITCRKDQTQDEIEVEIVKDNAKSKAILKPWIPRPEQKGIQFAELKSGAEVCLTAYNTSSVLFARSLSTMEVEHYNCVLQSVAKCAQTAPFLQEPPVIGQMVIARYIDDNHYRAIVTHVQDDEVTISYVDFGNVEKTKKKNLQVLSDDLKQLRSCTAKIILKDVPQDVPMTKDVNDYLSYLVGKEIPLQCTFDGAPSVDGVCLKLQNGDSVNNKITDLLTPSWKKSGEEDKKCYMKKDLEFACLGTVGDVVNALVLCTMRDGHKYVISPVDNDLITHIYETMPQMMNKFCESMDFYIPRDWELCLALYNGEWSRGICTCNNETPTTSTIFFVDFGNVERIDHRNIRLMPKDFVTPKAIGNICSVINLAPIERNGQYSSQVQERVRELVVPNELVKIKIVKCTNGSYDVELPEIRAQLIKEGLISI